MNNAESDREFEVYLLDSQRDGITQISNILQGHDQVDAIHLVSHGTAGNLNLGNTWLNIDNLDDYAGQITAWNDSLQQGADLLIYGCDLAASDEGRDLVDTLGLLCDCDVAASTDDTGHAPRGGDWELEYSTGVIETQLAFSTSLEQSWTGLLAYATYRDEFNSNSYDGSDGTQDWSGSNWQEIGESQNATSGVVRVSGDRLRIGGEEADLDNRGIVREVDLSSAATATLNFNYQRDLLEDRGGQIDLAISADGGVTWTELATYQLNGSDSNELFQSFDVTDYASANTQIRFLGSGDEVESYFYVDNVQIAYSENQLLTTDEFRVNTTTTGTQETDASIRGSQQAVAAAPDGSYVIVWSDSAADGDGYGVFAQRFDSKGAALGTEFQVNTTTTGDQRWATVATDGEGRFAVTWTGQDGDGTGVYLRRFHADGTAIDANDVLVNWQATLGNQLDPSIALNNTGQMVIAWQDSGANEGIYFKQFDMTSPATGGQAPASIVTVDTGANRENPSVDINDDGKFVITWEAGSEVRAQRYDAEATPRGSAITVDSFILFTDESQPVVTVQPSGDFVVVYRSDGLGATGLYLQHYRDNGTENGSEFKVDSGTSHVSPSITSDAAGNVLVVYQGNGDLDGSAAVGRLYNADFTAQSSEFLVNQTTAGDQHLVSAAMISQYELVVVFSGNGPGDTNGVFARQIGTSSSNSSPVITSDGGGSTAAVTVSENTTAVTTVTATDSDLPAQTLSYTISGGADASRFSLDSLTGELIFTTAPDFEVPADADSNNVYQVEVTVNDNNGGTDLQLINVTVVPLNDNTPVFTSSSTPSIAEGISNILTLSATDADQPADSISFSIVGGDDAAFFHITGSDKLKFNSVSDFDSPADADLDNVYEVTVRADDGNGGFTTQDIRVTITTGNNAPVISSPATVSISENSTFVQFVTSTDLDGDSVSYAIGGGSDAARFTINVTTGNLSLSTPANFEAPADADLDNQYEVVVTANDQNGGVDVQSLSVTVTDLNEAPTTNNDSYSIGNDQTLTTTSPGVLSNDTDEDGNPLTVALVRDTTHGTLTLNADGSFQYTPDEKFTGLDTFSYRVTDGLGGTATGSVTIQISGGRPIAEEVVASVNAEPATDDEEATMQSDTPQIINHVPIEGAVSATPPAPRQVTLTTSETATESQLVTTPPLSGNQAEPFTVFTIESIQQVTRNVLRATQESSLATAIHSNASFHPGLLWEDLGELEQTIQGNSDQPYFVAGSAAGITSALSVGYVIWTIRSGWLFTSLMTQLPAWRMVDPLVVLDYLEADPSTAGNSDDNDSLESLLEKDQPAADHAEHESAEATRPV